MSDLPEFPENEEINGSDEVLANDDLRLPEGASPLVRLHALRAWLRRMEKESTLEIGTVALELQEHAGKEPPLRRLEQASHYQQQISLQEHFQEAELRLRSYEEAYALLEECQDHTTSGERALVEYYLTIEEAIQALDDEETIRHACLARVLNHIEHLSISYEED